MGSRALVRDALLGSSREPEVIRKARFAIALVLVTAGWATLYCGCTLAMLFWLPAIFVFPRPPGYYTRSLRWPRWNAVGFFKGVSYALALVLFVVLMVRISDEQARGLFREWYIVVPAWLLSLSIFAMQYSQDHAKLKYTAGAAEAQQEQEKGNATEASDGLKSEANP
jgi:hypothetical protein